MVSLALRLLIAILLVAGLAGLEVKRVSDELSVVFLVDASDSMPPAARPAALGYIRDALQRMGSKDRVGVILFGADALVESTLSDKKELENFTSKVTSIQTDLAGAIRLGLALLPVDTARRLVILSDGIETSGDAYEAAKLAAASGTQIVVVPFRVQGGTEALILDVDAPGRLRTGDQFSLEIVMHSTQDQPVGIRVLAGAEVAFEGNVQLRTGTHAYSLPLVAGSPGFTSYRVQIAPLDDGFYQNNELAAFSQIEGPPKVLLVRNENPRDGVDESRELIAALEASNILVEVALPSGLPSELPALSNYASVILVDVPARDLSARQMAAIQTYVRDLGGGLVAVGGPSSYGVGGYFKTPLEETLPVQMEIKDQKRFPKVTFVVIMDKSGSMGIEEGGVMKMRLADEGAARVAELMHDFDEITIIAFDTAPVDVIGPLPGTEREQAAAKARTIGPGGGGIYVYEALQFAAPIIRQSANPTRHIILLSDGQDSEHQEGVRDLVRTLADEGITLSVVSIGEGPDVPFLTDIAGIGNGRFHLTKEAATIPNILTSEAAEVQRNYLIEETFFPLQTAPSPILNGIAAVPSLQGYIGTTAKDAARTILVSDLADGSHDPILAAWQYGLGRSVAWTSDATGRWAKNWVSWEQFTRFWAQVVRYTISQGAPANASVRVEHEGELATVTVDAKSDAGEYLNGLTMLVNVVGPDGQTQSVTLQQIAPGRYEGTFAPTTEGAYLIRVAGSTPEQVEGDSPPVAQTAGWVLSYSPEYQTLEADPNFLLRVAQLTNGFVVGDDLGVIFEHDLQAPARATRPIWPELFTLALLLLPLDIAVRRLVVTRYDLQRAWARGRAWLALHAPHPAPVPPQRAEQLSSLFKAKERAGTASKETEVVGASGRSPLPPPIVTRPMVTDDERRTTEAQPPTPIAAPPRQPASPSTPPAPSSTSAALLAKKRAREKKE
jgi:uncharacterized membrane protein